MPKFSRTRNVGSMRYGRRIILVCIPVGFNPDVRYVIYFGKMPKGIWVFNVRIPYTRRGLSIIGLPSNLG